MYHRLMAGITAFVLAGGKSSRMGADKAFIELAGRSLLSRALEVAAGVADQVFLVGRNPKLAEFGTLVPDIFPERGPLGGIHAALTSTTTELNLMVAVDMPYLESNLLRYLVDRANRCGALVTVPRVNGKFQPLCAVYRRTFVEMAGRAMAEDRNKIDALFVPDEIETVTEDELKAQGFSPLMFANVNTPKELEKARNQMPDVRGRE